MIVRDTGMTFREVDEMTLVDLHDIQASWDQAPPLFIMAAAYLGVKPREELKLFGEDQAQELAAMLGG